MLDLYLDSIEKLYFRANPAYRLTSLDRFSVNRQEIFKELTAEPEFHSLLIPRRQNGLTIKAIDQNTALLYNTLKKAAILPSYLGNILGADLNKTVLHLVFENILQVRIKNVFVSGISVFGELQTEIRHNSGEITDSKITSLSIEALKYAQALEINDIPELAARLYLYNFQPLTPFWKKQFPTPESLDEFLGIAPGGKLQALLDEYEAGSANSMSGQYWTSWRLLRSESKNDALIYKLYVSPDHKILRDTLPFIFESFVRNKVICFKLGKNLRGILRPDKIIAYFENFEKLQITAEQLNSELAGQPTQGVPFTTAISADGLLSWAIDPSKSQKIFKWEQEDSWRTWIAKRLAAAIIEAKFNRQATKTEPWQSALESLRIQGIDVQNWLPAKTFGANYSTRIP